MRCLNAQVMLGFSYCFCSSTRLSVRRVHVSGEVLPRIDTAGVAEAAGHRRQAVSSGTSNPTAMSWAQHLNALDRLSSSYKHRLVTLTSLHSASMPANYSAAQAPSTRFLPGEGAEAGLGSVPLRLRYDFRTRLWGALQKWPHNRVRY